ncbi:hypothetical protein SAMN02745216_00125 [Desulfatibacillum alkenivorans DSM 16219]|jgi:hypothetical protein|uniref:Uncharacterized protein n=1 Tax=Desulfatibacillum alkenivorans DSM 16219 TaxID=1121393 RepID=A0A1M6C1Q2_9BACT|nr:hypothetical protein [Desulfatibacillum alkenivorans]SHI54863.1 hypothetical protein SAMN02745216_00125 [Desulfatibacillum alkenivorans DSM 16219]
MIDSQRLCSKIREVSPGIGECGRDLEVHWDGNSSHWAVDLKSGSRELRHYLPSEDAEQCVLGEKCLSLGLEIAQLKDNVQLI